MARIRSIKPEFWTSAQVMECSTNARLLFIGLWNFCDDAGRHADSPKQLKAQIFPGDEFSLENVRGLIDELSANGLVIRYRADGASLLQVTGWHHQRIDKPNKPRFPGVDEGEIEATPRTIDERSRLIGEDRIGEDRKGKDLKDGASATRSANGTADEDLEFEAFQALYPQRNGSNPWMKARSAINARIAEGVPWEQLLEGARRYSAWCAATGKVNTEHVMQAARFCGPSREFLLAWDLPATKADTRLAANIQAAAQAKRELFGGTR